MEHAICYISTASAEFSEAQIRELFKKWQDNNSSLDIKGILLFSEGNFFQVLEGERTKVLDLYSSIVNDTRHNNIIQVMGKDVEKPSLDGYITEHVTQRNFSRPDLLQNYCESVKGMDSHIQDRLKELLEIFIDTRVL